MTSYPMHLTTADISDDLNVGRQTVERWIRSGKIIGIHSMRFWVVSGYHYVQFLLSNPEYKEKSDYYKSYQSYMRRKKYVQKNKKESRDDS